jgi:hypothetical protein
MKPLFFVLGGILIVCTFGFYLGVKLQPVEREVDSILFSTTQPDLTDPRWFLRYLKGEDYANYFKIQIKETDLHPIFSHLTTSQYPPSSIYTNYGLREVAFIIEDYHNLGLDPEGVLIILHPFQSPKNVPKVFLGRRALRLGTKLEGPIFEKLAFIKKTFYERLDWIDFSHTGVLPPYRTINLGFRQERNPLKSGKILLVRLNPDHLESGVKELQAFLKSVPIVGMDKVVKLDLRRKGLGFLQTVENDAKKDLPVFDDPFWQAKHHDKNSRKV